MQERFIARQMQRWRSPINENMETPVGMQGVDLSICSLVKAG